jgi:hypothetical protein
MLLTNMSARCSDSKTCAEIVRRIEALLADFPGDREVALMLAGGLVNLSNRQDAEGAQASVGRIEALLADFPGDREVALELAKGLVNLSIRYRDTDDEKTHIPILQLMALLDEYPELVPVLLSLTNQGAAEE